MATFSFEIEDSEIAIMLRDDISFARLLREKILDMKNLPDMKDALIEAAKSQVVSQLKQEIMTNLFEKVKGNNIIGSTWTVLKDTAQGQISEMVKEQMYKAVSDIIKQRDEITQQRVNEKLAEHEHNIDYDKVMLQAAKELLRESQKPV